MLSPGYELFNYNVAIKIFVLQFLKLRTRLIPILRDEYTTAATASGAGYWVLLSSGEVAAYGDAPDAGGMRSKNVRWSKPAAAITAVRGTDGYVISSRDGGLYPFNGAPFLGSFAGSGTTVVGLAAAAR